MKTLRIFLICLFLTLSGFSNSTLAQPSFPESLGEDGEPPELPKEILTNPIWAIGTSPFSLLPQAIDLESVSSGPGAMASSSFWCGYNPEHAAMLAGVTEETWSSWISRISGEEEVVISGQPVTITTRYSYSLFNGTSPAFTYLRETVEDLGYLPAQIEEDPYIFNSQEWKNLILTIPGTSNPNEIVILSAHYNSISSSAVAPGADDNGSGSAALLEAARILQGNLSHARSGSSGLRARNRAYAGAPPTPLTMT